MKTSHLESLTGRVDVPFPEYRDAPGEPMPLVRRWIAEAQTLGVREPKALALATANGRGQLSSRIVVIHDLDDTGLRFVTHATSRKATDLAENGWACGLLYWRETGQQIAIGGPVAMIDRHDAEAIWDARPAGTHAMSVASVQSRVLDDHAALRRRAARDHAAAVALPMPDRFVGYRLVPQEVEFWAASSDRLHKRLAYRRETDGWRCRRLQP